MQKKEMAGLMVIAAGCLWGVIGLFSRKLSAAGFDAVQITALRSLVTAAGLFYCSLAKTGNFAVWTGKICGCSWAQAFAVLPDSTSFIL